MKREELVHRIGEKVFKDFTSRHKTWAHAVVSAKIEKSSSEMTGFAYDREGGHQPCAPRDFEILELLEQLRDAIARVERKPPWLACLLRLERKTRRLTLEFEYVDDARWAISFQNSRQRAVELRPVLAAAPRARMSRRPKGSRKSHAR